MPAAEQADSYTTSFTDEKNDVILMQGEEELDETDAPYGEDVAEYGNHKRNIRPGVTIRCIYQYALKAETGTVNFTLTAKNQENPVITYDFDLAALPGAPAEAFVAKEIAAPDFNNGWPESGEIKDYYSGQAQHNLVIKNAEFVDGEWKPTSCLEDGILYITCRNCEHTDKAHSSQPDVVYEQEPLDRLPHAPGNKDIIKDVLNVSDYMIDIFFILF